MGALRPPRLPPATVWDIILAMSAARRRPRIAPGANALALAITVATAALAAGPAAAGAGAGLVEGRRVGAIPPDGYWAELAPPLRTEHATVLDPVRRSLIVIGGFDGALRDDIWTLSLDGTPTWTRLEVAGPRPAARMGHTAVYDPVGDRVLVFGGRTAIPYSDVWLDDVWELSLTGTPVWNLLDPQSGRPPVRSDHSAIYDPTRRRMVVFGGFGIPPGAPGEEHQDTWAFELEGPPRWTPLTTTPTPTRSSHVAVYDAAGDRMVIHGGTQGAIVSSATWALSFATGEWQELLPAGLPAPDRLGHGATFDPIRRRLVFFAGVRFADGEFFLENDVWALELAGSPAWARIEPLGTRPSPRSGHALAYDPATDRIVAACGWDGQARGDVWTLALPEPRSWTPLRVQEPGPLPREGAVAVHDPPRNQILLYGGRIGSEFVSDCWALSLGARPEWRRIAAAHPPPGRAGATLTYDPPRDRFILHGGIRWGPSHDDLWQLTLTPTPAWSRLGATGASPGPRGEHSAVYDPVGDRLLVFGGVDTLRNRNDTWALALADTPRWSALAPVGEPPAPRSEHSAVYDPAGHRMVVFGGFFPYQNDVWELALGPTPEWKWLAPLGSPPAARRGHTAVYDPGGRRMLVFGGRALLMPVGVEDHHELWELRLDAAPAWRLLAPEGPPPLGRMLHAAELDPRGRRMIVVGGEHSEPFAFPAPTWQVVLGPAAPVFGGASVAWDRVRVTWQSQGGPGEEVALHRRAGAAWPEIARKVADGEGTVTFEDADVVPGARYEYRAEQNGLASEPWTVVIPYPRLRISGSRPSPARDAWVIAYSLVSDRPARLEIFDLRGRKVFDAPIPSPRPGAGTMDPGPARALAAGVYLARITQDGRTASARIAVIR